MTFIVALLAWYCAAVLWLREYLRQPVENGTSEATP